MNLTQELKKLQGLDLSLNLKKAILRNDRQIKKVESKFTKAINQQLKWYYKKAGQFYPSLFVDQLTSEHAKRISEVLAIYYNEVFKISVAFTTEQYKSEITELETKSLKLYKELLQKYITSKALLKAVGMANTSKKRVITVITSGTKAGKSPDSISKDIASLAKVSIVRAALIARTEVFAAMNYSQIETARVYKDRYNIEKKKQWVAINDNRVRETHIELNGEEPIGLDDKFTVGGYQCDAPHDESLPAEEVINCRCNLVFVND
jgi:SPP1 gp7 family putative phage head morphogenesis protein